MSSVSPRGVAALLLACGLTLGATLLSVQTPSAIAQQPDSAAAAAPARIATVDVFGIIEKMIQSDRYMPAREANNKEQRDRLDAMVAELQKLQTELQSLDPSKAETQTMAKDFDTKRQEFQQAQYEAQQNVEKFNTIQLNEVYVLVVDAVDKVSQAKGYTHVLASKAARAENKSETVSASLQEILARPVVRAPAADDLTPLVMKELAL